MTSHPASFTSCKWISTSGQPLAENYETHPSWHCPVTLPFPKCCLVYAWYCSTGSIRFNTFAVSRYFSWKFGWFINHDLGVFIDDSFVGCLGYHQFAYTTWLSVSTQPYISCSHTNTKILSTISWRFMWILQVSDGCHQVLLAVRRDEAARSHPTILREC